MAEIGNAFSRLLENYVGSRTFGKCLSWMHLPRPDWRPDALATWWATRCSGDLVGDQMAPGRPDCCWSCCLLGKYQGLLNKCEQKQASFDDQIAPGDQIGRPDFHILVTSKIWSPIWSPGSIWSPQRLVVYLVVVDAVTFTTFHC